LRVSDFESVGRRFESCRACHLIPVHSGHIGYSLFRAHREHFCSKRVVDWLQPAVIRIEVPQVVLHKTDQPDLVLDLLDSHVLSGKRSTEIDLLTVVADASTLSDSHGSVMHRISQLPQSSVGPGGFAVEISRNPHLESLKRSLPVVLVGKVINAGLLLQEVSGSRPSRLVFQGQMHAFIPTVLLGMSRFDALDLDTRNHHTESLLRPYRALPQAKGIPLSVRMARGSPKS